MVPRVLLAAALAALAGCGERPRTLSEVDAEGRARMTPHLPAGWTARNFSESPPYANAVASAEFEAPGLDGRPLTALAGVSRGSRPGDPAQYRCWVSEPGAVQVGFDFSRTPEGVDVAYGDPSAPWLAHARGVARRAVELLKVGAKPYMD